MQPVQSDRYAARKLSASANGEIKAAGLSPGLSTQFGNAGIPIDQTIRAAGGAAASSVAGVGPGGLIPPIDEGKIISILGDSRDGGSRLHRGTDFGAPAGTDIHAVDDQTITAAGWLGGGYGWGVKAVDSQGHEHVYAHMREDPGKLGIKKGQVTQGSFLGHVGNSGNARNTPSHVHYEDRPFKGGYNQRLDSRARMGLQGRQAFKRSMDVPSKVAGPGAGSGSSGKDTLAEEIARGREHAIAQATGHRGGATKSMEGLHGAAKIGGSAQKGIGGGARLPDTDKFRRSLEKPIEMKIHPKVEHHTSLRHNYPSARQRRRQSAAGSASRSQRHHYGDTGPTALT